jgi:hypothetical protein
MQIGEERAYEFGAWRRTTHLGTAATDCGDTHNYIKYSSWDEEHDKAQLQIQNIKVPNLMRYWGLFSSHTDVLELHPKLLNIQMGH